MILLKFAWLQECAIKLSKHQIVQLNKNLQRINLLKNYCKKVWVELMKRDNEIHQWNQQICLVFGGFCAL